MSTCTSARESMFAIDSLFGTFYVKSPIDSGAVLYGSQTICPDKFIFGVLDYLFAVGVLGLGVLDFGLWTSLWDYSQIRTIH